MTDEELAEEADEIIRYLNKERIAWVWSDTAGYKGVNGRIAGTYYFEALGRLQPMLMKGSRLRRRMMRRDRDSLTTLIERWMRRYKFTFVDMDDDAGEKVLWGLVNRGAKHYPAQRVNPYIFVNQYTRIINGKSICIGFREPSERKKWEASMALYHMAQKVGDA